MIFYIFFGGNENPNNYRGIILSNLSEKLFNKMFNRVKHKLENKTYLKPSWILEKTPESQTIFTHQLVL